MPRTTPSPADAAAVGKALRAAREQIGLSQTGLAERLDVSPAYVNKLEAGRANLTIGALARVAQALGCQLEVRLLPRSALQQSPAEALAALN